MKIDAVITWVDGDDPHHREKRARYGSKEMFAAQDVAGETRFSSLGEIFWCVASINRFAPWINRIYIVTDGQDPGLNGFLEEAFPEGHIPVEIVDHKVIFRGYEEYLPTFNSVSLETMTWRIPGLSDRFIELNDDFMLTAPVTPEDFFTPDGKPVCYAKRYSVALTRFTRLFKHRKDGSKKVTFKGLMLNAASLAGSRSFYFRLDHTPRALRRDFYENYFSKHKELMARNIRYRFRDPDQFTPQELQYLTLYRKGECVQRDSHKVLFFLQPKRKRDYVKRKLEKLDRMKSCKFICFNSMDLASEPDRAMIMSMIENRLGLKFR